MKRIILITFLLISTILLFADSVGKENDWLKENPFLGHWLSYEEMLLNKTYFRDFTPTDPPTGEVRQTSEFEQMEGVLVVYPLGIPYSLVAEISQDVIVYTIVTSGSQTQCQNNYQNNGINMENCQFINAPTNSYWVRDYGPWFIANDNEIAIVDFPYNRPRPLDDEIPVIVADYFGIDLYGMDIEHTGGNYMCDGNYVGASTDLVYDENPNLTPAQIAQLVQDFLGINTYHVTIDPLDDYIRHIDCWGKFLDVDKVMIGQVPETDYRFEDFEFVADYFAEQTSAWGNNYEVYRIYTPGGYYQATPYTNSLIVNSKVFVPITGSQWDDEAIASYEEAMPGYEIFGIYYTGWYDTDALHCRTKGIADRNMLYIRHIPFQGEQLQRPDYEIEADIIPYSGLPVYTDSLLVFYKLDGGEYSSVQMTLVEDFTYVGIIPSQPQGTEVAYYIHAADESGQSRNHPFIGAPDPYIFIAGGQAPAELVVDPESFEIEMQPDEILIEYLELKNIGEVALNYTISLSEPVTWMSLVPMSGSVAGSDSIYVEITFDSSDLTPDDYTCQIIITDDREETIVPVTLTVTGNNAEEELLINTTQILGIYPNPFNPQTTISFSLKDRAEVKLSIYNIRGQKVRTLVNNTIEAGIHEITWNGKDDNNKNVSSGIYFSVFDVDDNGSDYTSVKKVILLK